MKTEKICTKCGVTKTSDEFAKHSATKDGLQCECKQCKAKRYLDNRENIRASQKVEWIAYADQNREVLNEKSRVRRLHTKEKDAAYRAQFNIECAPKIAAKNAIWSHLLTGRLERKPCEMCGCNKADAHHDDYAKPLDVRWLCRKHHARWHSEHGEAPNGRAIEKKVRGEE